MNGAVANRAERSKILVINSGSSSIKTSVFALEPAEHQEVVEPVWKAQVNFKGGEAEISIKHGDGKIAKRKFANKNHADGLKELFRSVTEGSGSPICNVSEIRAVGHRVVHGGEKYVEPVLISDAVKEEMQSLTELAPAHERANLLGVDLASAHFPGAPQIAVFDTAFHQTMPEEAVVYALPYEWYEKKRIRRYGFHGISHSYCLDRAAILLDRKKEELRMINCHLGSGNSLCAIKYGASIMTTMGFTPLEGLVMGTRAGSIDPGIIFHLLGKCGYTAEALQETLNNRSGLRGVSGLSGDMREIQEAAETNKQAQLALELYVRSLTANIAALVPLLGGLDALAFTGGIGENSTLVRKMAAERLTFLGLALSEQKNNLCSSDSEISSDNAQVHTLVIHANEELAIARECLRVLGK